MSHGLGKIMQLLTEFKRIICPTVDICCSIMVSEIVGNRLVLPSIRFFPQTLESLRNSLSGIILPIRGLKKISTIRANGFGRFVVLFQKFCHAFVESYIVLVISF